MHCLKCLLIYIFWKISHIIKRSNIMIIVIIPLLLIIPTHNRYSISYIRVVINWTATFSLSRSKFLIFSYVFLNHVITLSIAWHFILSSLNKCLFPCCILYRGIIIMFWSLSLDAILFGGCYLCFLLLIILLGCNSLIERVKVILSCSNFLSQSLNDWLWFVWSLWLLWNFDSIYDLSLWKCCFKFNLIWRWLRRLWNHFSAINLNILLKSTLTHFIFAIYFIKNETYLWIY